MFFYCIFICYFQSFCDIFLAFVALVLYPDTSVRKNIRHSIYALKLIQAYTGTGCVYEYRLFILLLFCRICKDTGNL